MLYVKNFVKKTGVCTVVDSRTGKSEKYSLEDLNDLRAAGITVKGFAESGDFAYPVELLQSTGKDSFVYGGRRAGNAPFDVFLRVDVKLPCGNAIEREYCEIGSSVYDVVGKSYTCHGLFATFVDSDKKIRTYPVELLDINDTEVYLKLKGKSASDNIRRFNYYGYGHFPVNQNIWKRVDIGKCVVSYKKVLNASFINAVSGFYHYLKNAYFVSEDTFDMKEAMTLTRESLSSGKGLVYFYSGLGVPLQELFLNFVSMVFNIKESKQRKGEYKFSPRVVDSSLLLPRGKTNGILSFLIDLFYPVDTDELCIFGDKLEDKIICSKKSVGEAILRRADDLVPLAFVDIAEGFCPEDDLTDIVSVLTKNGLSGCVNSYSYSSALFGCRRVVHTLRGSYVFEPSCCIDYLGIGASSDKDIMKSVARGRLSSDGEMTINAKGEVIVSKLPSNGDLKFLDKGLYITNKSLSRDLDLTDLRRIYLPASYRGASKYAFLNPNTLPFSLKELTLVSKNKRIGVVISLINAIYALEERINAVTVTVNMQTGTQVHELINIKCGSASEKATLLAALLCSEYSNRGIVEQLVFNSEFINSFTDEESEAFYDIIYARVLCEGKLYNKVRFSTSAIGSIHMLEAYNKYLVIGKEITSLISSARKVQSNWGILERSGIEQNKLQLLRRVVALTNNSESALIERVGVVGLRCGFAKSDPKLGIIVKLTSKDLPSLSEDSD